MKLYLNVTQDKFQLPLVVADSVKALAKDCGTTENNIYSQINKWKHGIIKRNPKYIIVEVDDDEF